MFITSALLLWKHEVCSERIERVKLLILIAKKCMKEGDERPVCDFLYVADKNLKKSVGEVCMLESMSFHVFVL